MKVRTLIVAILGVLVISTLSLGQQAGSPEPRLQEPVFVESAQTLPTQAPWREPGPENAPATEGRSRRQYVGPTTRNPAPTRPTQPIPPGATPPTMLRAPRDPLKAETKVEIFELRYADPEELSTLIYSVLRIATHPDQRLKRLIVNATDEEMKSIASLIESTDVPVAEIPASELAQNLIYRIYMFEIPFQGREMKPFSMILQVPQDVSMTQVLDASRDDELQISGFCLSDELDADGKAEILIQGRAASSSAIKHMVVDEIPGSRIKELQWDDAETFTDGIKAAQFTRLTPEMQNHIEVLLGDDIRTVGYWFGNLSAPGEVQAPIGPWTLKLRLDVESDRMLELDVDVEVPGERHYFQRRLRHQPDSDILSNTVRAKIGKPIIIGYNRESYGTRKMGAMVIVPEADSFESDPASAKSF